MNYPNELAGWAVDECIEALGIDNGLEVELLTVAPTAYREEVQLETVWNKLTEASQSTLIELAIKELNDRDDEDLEVN